MDILVRNFDWGMKAFFQVSGFFLGLAIPMCVIAMVAIFVMWVLRK